MHLPEVQTRKKRKARSTLHNFCQLGQAPARGSDPKKKSAIHSPQFLFARPSAIHSPQFLSARASTCPRFRPEKKRKARSTLHNFCQLGLAQARGSDPKKRKVRSTLHFFCQLGLARARVSDPKEGKVRSTLHNFCQLGRAPARGSHPKKRKKCDPLSTISVSSAEHLPEV